MMKNEWLYMNCPPFPAFISCGRSFFKPGDVHAERIFPTFVIMFMTQGTVYFTEGAKQYDLTAGEYFIQTPGIKHFGHKPSCENAEYYWIHFLPCGNYSECLPELEDANKSKGLTVIDSGLGIRKPELMMSLKMNSIFPVGQWSNLLSELVHTFYFLQDPVKAQSLFTELLGCMAREKNANCLYEKDILADRVHRFIKENYKNNINLKDISSHFHFSSDYISRCFRQRFKLSPSEYITRLKMDYARNMLTSTNKSIESIANELSYKDLAVFSRMFKIFEGVSPSKYRLKIWRNDQS